MVVAGLDGEDVEMIIDDTLASPEFSADGEEVLVAPYVGGLAPEDAAPTEIVTSDGEEVALDEEDPGHVSLQLAADGSADGREVTTGVYAAPYRMATGRSPVWSTQDTMLLMDMSEDTGTEVEPRYVLVHFGEE